MKHHTRVRPNIDNTAHDAPIVRSRIVRRKVRALQPSFEHGCRVFHITEDMIDRIDESNPHIAAWKRRLQETRDRLRREKAEKQGVETNAESTTLPAASRSPEEAWQKVPSFHPNLKPVTESLLPQMKSRLPSAHQEKTGGKSAHPHSSETNSD